MKTWKAKWFGELTAAEIYGILRSRSEIFVVEQKCIYQDPDGNDENALHVFCEEDGRVTACLRAFRKDPETVQMGRVLTLEHGTGLGGELLKRGIREIRKQMKPKRMCIEAQTYATGFYEREGFHVCSGEFPEDGIPHVKMILDCLQNTIS